MWKHQLIPFELSKNNSNRFVDLLIYENLHVLVNKLHIFQGNHNCKFVCRRCSTSYNSQIVLLQHKQRCEQQEITNIRASNEFHFFWKSTFIRNYFTLGL